jgi:hypothetical protein
MNPIAFFNREIRITLREDRAEMLICFAIAAVFWFLVKLSQQYETDWAFQCRYVLPEQEAFTQRPPELVTAQVSGTGWNLLYHSIFRKKEVLVFDLNQLPASLLDRRLIIDRLQGLLSQDDLVVKNISLDFISLKYEPRATRRVPLSLAYQIRLQPQHDFQSPYSLTPDSVTITGPASLVTELKSWPTEPGQTPLLKSAYTATVALAKDKNGVLELDVAETTLDIHIEPVVEKTVFYVPVTVNHAPESIRIFPGSVTVYCVVGMSAYNLVDASDFTIEADLSGIEQRSSQNTVPLNLTCSPDYVKNIRFSPQSVVFFFQVGN